MDFLSFLREVFLGKPKVPALEEDRYPVGPRGTPDLTRFTKPMQHYTGYIDDYLRSLKTTERHENEWYAREYRKMVYGQWGLIARGPQEALPYVLQMLEHRESEARSAAAGILDRWANDSTLVQHLLNALRTEQDIETLSILADTLGRLKVRDALPRLAELIRAPDASNGDLDWNVAGAIGEISGQEFGQGRERVAAADSWLRNNGY